MNLSSLHAYKPPVNYYWAKICYIINFVKSIINNALAMNNTKKLFRDTENKMLGGVAAGLANYFDIDPTLVRVLFVLAFFIPVSFPIVFAYIVLWAIMPAKRTVTPNLHVEQPMNPGS